MKTNTSKILSYFFPETCLACHEVFPFGEEKEFCESCQKEVCYLSDSICKVCGEDLQNPDLRDSLCGDCLQNLPPFQWARSLFELSPVLSKILYSFKYSADETALSWMGNAMSQYLNRYFQDLRFDCLIPVPLHSWRLLRRGYNQSLLLAKELARIRNEKLDYQNLIKKKSTIAQSTLSKKERMKELKGAFLLKHSSEFEGKNVLLVDDVYTTGSTVRECASLYKKAGAEVYVLTLMRAPLEGEKGQE